MIWILLLVIVCIIFTYFVGFVLPKLLFRMKLLKKIPRGTGQKVVEEVYGTTVLYEADKSINKHIQQYLISNRNSKTILLCDIDPTIYYLDYTCVCYNSKGNVCKMITVKENITSRGVTKEVELPHMTRTVGIIINQVNEEKIKNSFMIHMRFSSLVLYGLVEYALLLGLSYFAKFCISKNGSGIFHDSFMLKMFSPGYFFLVLGLVAVSIIIIQLTHKVNYVHKEVK